MGLFDKLGEISAKFIQSTSENPQVQVLKEGTNSRTLGFSSFMGPEMKSRIKNRELDWMDKVAIFEDFYIPFRKAQGWIEIKGGRSNDDRFRIEWSIGDEVIIATYDDFEFTVTERLKKSRK
jgi:hypothetical protein